MFKQYLKIIDIPGKGKGVISKIKIPANSAIVEFSGDIYTEETMPDPNHPALLQINFNSFIGPSGDVDDYINHSCDPNCYLYVVGSRAICYSLYDIAPGTELTFDYSTTSTDTQEKWSLECACGSNKCRKTISGLHYLNDDLKTEYASRGMLPLFLTNKMLQ